MPETGIRALQPRIKWGTLNAMTVEILENELKTLPEAERFRIICGAMQGLSPQARKAPQRQLRRFAPPEVPEDVWTGFEEAEDGQGIEVRDADFQNRDPSGTID